MIKTSQDMDINQMIPMPVFSALPGSTLGKPWWQRIKLYWTEPQMYRLEQDWVATTPDGLKIKIDRGFLTDFASIPWFLRWFMTATGPLIRGALPHDFGYRYNYLRDHAGNKICVGKGQQFFDDLFRDIVIWTTGLITLAWAAWAGVRQYGYRAWDNHRDGAHETR